MHCCVNEDNGVYLSHSLLFNILLLRVWREASGFRFVRIIQSSCLDSIRDEILPLFSPKMIDSLGYYRLSNSYCELASPCRLTSLFMRRFLLRRIKSRPSETKETVPFIYSNPHPAFVHLSLPNCLCSAWICDCVCLCVCLVVCLFSSVSLFSLSVSLS